MDGTFRKIEITVKAPGNPKVRTRSGYYATQDQASAGGKGPRNNAILIASSRRRRAAGAAGSAPSDDDKPTVFRADTRIVVCHTTVIDKAGHLVTTLPAERLQRLRKQGRQEIRRFKREDVPVSLGLVIDNSGSMRNKLAQVKAAALALVKESNRDDEVFIVNFNDSAYLDNPKDKPFTNDMRELEAALAKIDTRGGTAMRDAIEMSIQHLKERAPR